MEMDMQDPGDMWGGTEMPAAVLSDGGRERKADFG